MVPTRGFSWLRRSSLVSEASHRREPQRKKTCSLQSDGQTEGHTLGCSQWKKAKCGLLAGGRVRFHKQRPADGGEEGF